MPLDNIVSVLYNSLETLAYNYLRGEAELEAIENTMFFFVHFIVEV